MRRLHRIGRSAALLLCAATLVSGCGGAAAGSEATTAPVSQASQSRESSLPTPVVPADLWQLVPPGALAIADVDVARLRQWTQLGRLRQWAQRYACASPTDLEAFDGIDRVIVAIGGDDFLVLVQGRSVDENDVPAAVKEDYRNESVTFRVLAPGTVLFATPRWSDAVGARLRASETESVRSTSFVAALSPMLDADGAVLVVMSAPAREVVQKMATVLTQWGVSKIGQGLSEHAHWGMSARLEAGNSGIVARGAVAGGTEASTTSLVEAVNSTFWQAGLVMRLFGLPAVLSSARFQQSGGSASVDIQATAADLNILAPRLEELIKARAGQCAPAPIDAGAVPATGPLEVTP